MWTHIHTNRHHLYIHVVLDYSIQLGNSKAQVKVFNVSTGKVLKGGTGKTAGAALCLAFDSTGTQLWVGDSKVGGTFIGLVVLHWPFSFFTRGLSTSLNWTLCLGSCRD